MCAEIACVLLLSTILWILSSGGKGGLQSHREPLSILGLATVVVYFYIISFSYKLYHFYLFDYTHIVFQSNEIIKFKWFKIKNIYNKLSELIWYNYTIYMKSNFII
eukprot:404832_1